MADYHDLVSALTWLLVNKLQAKSEYTRGLLGDGAGKVQVPDRPDYTYVRPDRFSTRVYEVFNKMVSGPDGLPVVLGELPWQPELTQVLSVDWDTYLGVGWGDLTPGLPRHGQTHEWRDAAPGYDAFNVYRRQMGELRTYPVGSGSSSVYVTPYNFTHLGDVKSWGGLPGLDLSNAVPAGTGTARMALVYWHPYSGTSGFLGVATGTLGVDAEPEILNRPAAPAGTIASAWVRLAGGQNSITEYDIWDARPLWMPSLDFATGSSGIWADIIPIGDPGDNFTGTTVEAALEQLADSGGGSPSGAAGGDLTGTYPNPLVAGIYGYPLAEMPPAVNDVLVFTGSAWHPTQMATGGGGAPTGPAGGDLTGTYPNPLTAGIYGYPYGLETPSEGDVLMYTGSAWRPVAGVGYPFDMVTIDDSAPGADYATLDSAWADIATSSFVRIGPGTYTATTDPPNAILLSAFNENSSHKISGPTTGGVEYGIRINGSQLKGLYIESTPTGTDDGVGVEVTGGCNIAECEIVVTTEVGTGDLVGIELVASASLALYTGRITVAGGNSQVGIKNNGSSVVLYGCPVIDATTFFSGSGTFTGIFQDTSGNLYQINGPAGTESLVSNSFPVENRASGTVSAGEIGYINEEGYFFRTATAYEDIPWAVVVKGGAHQADIYVTRRGRTLLELNGNCSAGDYLYTSTTAGQAQPQSYVRPEIFAVALTANSSGAGGTCEALLLTGRKTVLLFNSNDLHRTEIGTLASDSDWVGNINDISGDPTIEYNNTSGDEKNLATEVNTQISKLVLHNTTRSNYALIDSADITAGAGDGTITLTDNIPGDWANSDVITLRSQTNTDTVNSGASYFVDFEIEDTTEIPALAVAIGFRINLKDSGAAGESTWVHPWETGNASKRITTTEQVANQNTFDNNVFVPINQRRFCAAWSGSGSGTLTIQWKMNHILVATP